MEKHIKVTGLMVGGLVFAEGGYIAAAQVRKLVDNMLISRISQNGMADDAAIRTLAFLNYIHYDQVIAVLLVMAAAFVSSLVFDKIFPGSKIRTFIIFFIIPLAFGQIVNIK